jgi:hypothetical protein
MCPTKTLRNRSEETSFGRPFYYHCRRENLGSPWLKSLLWEGLEENEFAISAGLIEPREMSGSVWNLGDSELLAEFAEALSKFL